MPSNQNLQFRQQGCAPDKFLTGLVQEQWLAGIVRAVTCLHIDSAFTASHTKAAAKHCLCLGAYQDLLALLIAALLRRMSRTASSVKSRVEYIPALDESKTKHKLAGRPPGNYCEALCREAAFQSTREHVLPQFGLSWRWKS